MLSRGEVDFVVSGLPPLIARPASNGLGYLPRRSTAGRVQRRVGVNAKKRRLGAPCEVPGDTGALAGVKAMAGAA